MNSSRSNNFIGFSPQIKIMPNEQNFSNINSPINRSKTFENAPSVKYVRRVYNNNFEQENSRDFHRENFQSKFKIYL